jgi:hypothetical protein
LEPLWVDGPVLPQVLVDEMERLDIGYSDDEDDGEDQESPLDSEDSEDSE